MFTTGIPGTRSFNTYGAQPAPATQAAPFGVGSASTYTGNPMDRMVQLAQERAAARGTTTEQIRLAQEAGGTWSQAPNHMNTYGAQPMMQQSQMMQPQAQMTMQQPAQMPMTAPQMPGGYTPNAPVYPDRMPSSPPAAPASAPSSGNPYLQEQAGNIASNMTRNFNTNVLPGINQGAMAAGGFGGSRQGIAQGLGMRGLNDSIGQAQTSLYSNAYNTDQQIRASKDIQAASLQAQQKLAEMNDATQRLSLGNSFNLGLGQLGLGATQANQNFFNTQRGLDISQMGLGANLTNTANTGLTNQGQQLTNLGQTQQNAPWQQLGNFANTLSPFSGLGQSSSVTTPGASTVGSAMGGALTAAQLWQLISGGPR